MNTLKDSFGRSFPYIRLSITDVCNFKCGYCLPNGYQNDKSDNRTFIKKEEIGRLAKALSELGVCKIRLTGGEPTVRKDFFDIIKILKENSGIKKTVITTNGVPKMICARTIPVWVAAKPALAMKKNIATPEIINGTIIGEMSTAMINPLYGICLLLNPNAATVPSKTEPIVAKIAIIKLFLAAKPHGFLVP